MSEDPAAEAARAAAALLAPEFGPALPVQVEAALAARDTGPRRSQYFADPVSLASLIVSIATLAWTIYNDQRSRAAERKSGPEPQPNPEVIAREVRIKLREQDIALPSGTERITEIVTTEIVRRSAMPR